MQKKKYRGVLVANAFLRTKKFTEHYGWLKAAAEKCGMDLAFLSNSDLLFPLCSKKVSAGTELKQMVEAVALENDFVIYWDKDIPLGNMLQFFCREQNVPVFNSLDSIAVCDNKYETYQKLWEWNQSCARGEEIPILPTIAAPMTYENIGYYKVEIVEDSVETQKEVIKITDLYKDIFTDEELRMYAIVSLVLTLILI